MKTYHAFGLNHETAPVALRERFALDAASMAALYDRLPVPAPFELIGISTCNRTECYLYGTDDHVAFVEDELARQRGRRWQGAAFFAYHGPDALRHVVEVVTGLRSQVPGDAQIGGQFRTAYRAAVAAGLVGPYLHRLAQEALRARKPRPGARRVRRPGSVAGAAVAAVRRHLAEHGGRSMTEARVLVVGAGAMGRDVAVALCRQGVGTLVLANRSARRAHELAWRTGAQVVAWDARYEQAGRADAIIVASGAGRPVLTRAAMPERDAGAPALVVDLAVPRNVEPAAGDLPGYTVMDIDALGARPEADARDRARAGLACEQAVRAVQAWAAFEATAGPAVRALRDAFETVRRREVERYRHRFGREGGEELDRLTRSILQKVLAVPVERLKAGGAASIPVEQPLAMLADLFGIEGCEAAAARPRPHGAPGATPADPAHTGADAWDGPALLRGVELAAA